MNTVCITCSWSTVKLVLALLAGLGTALESSLSATDSASFISSFRTDNHRTRVIWHVWPNDLTSVVVIRNLMSLLYSADPAGFKAKTVIVLNNFLCLLSISNNWQTKDRSTVQMHLYHLINLKLSPFIVIWPIKKKRVCARGSVVPNTH